MYTEDAVVELYAVTSTGILVTPSEFISQKKFTQFIILSSFCHVYMYFHNIIIAFVHRHLTPGNQTMHIWDAVYMCTLHALYIHHFYDSPSEIYTILQFRRI